MGFDVKNTTFFGLFDLLFPHSCRCCGRLGDVLCERCKKHNKSCIIKICARCKKSIAECKCVCPVYTVAWREGVMSDLVEEYKYKSVRDIARILAEMLNDAIPSSVSEALIVPLPTIGRHIRERGFDHTRLLAENLAKCRPGFRVQEIIKRCGKNVQVGADEKTRKLQAAKAYEVLQKVDATKRYLLLDDVWTTGASMEAAMKVIRKAGAKDVMGAVVVAGR